MTTIMFMKKRIFLLLMAIMILCTANVSVFAVEIIPDGVIIEEALGIEDVLMPMGARGYGGYNLPANFLNGGSWSDNYYLISSHLETYHGVSAITLSNNIHAIKQYYNLPANYNCIFDYTGGVYNQNGIYLGSLVTGV